VQEQMRETRYACMYTTGCSSALRKNDITVFLGKWMELEVFKWGEISFTKTSLTCFLSYVDSSGEGRESIGGTHRVWGGHEGVWGSGKGVRGWMPPSVVCAPMEMS
jgi:hypothetical protein